MNFELPKIYPITDKRITQLSHGEQVRKLIEGGATFIQLRDKSASAKDFYESAGEALEIARTSNVSRQPYVSHDSRGIHKRSLLLGLCGGLVHIRGKEPFAISAGDYLRG